MKTAILVGLGIGLSACGGAVSSGPTIPPDGGYSVVFGPGTIDDAGAPSGSVFAVIGPLVNTGKPNGQDLGIFMVNRAVFGHTCSAILAAGASNNEYPNVQELNFGVGNESGSLTPGTYSVTSSDPTAQASAALTTTDSACHGTELPATSGTVAIGTDVMGSYDLTFGPQGSLSGQFIIPLCAQPATTSQADAGPPVCLQ